MISLPDLIMTLAVACIASIGIVALLAMVYFAMREDAYDDGWDFLYENQREQERKKPRRTSRYLVEKSRSDRMRYAAHGNQISSAPNS